MDDNNNDNDFKDKNLLVITACYPDTKNNVMGDAR